jgi:hypothetical protein
MLDIILVAILFTSSATVSVGFIFVSPKQLANKKCTARIDRPVLSQSCFAVSLVKRRKSL